MLLSVLGEASNVLFSLYNANAENTADFSLCNFLWPLGQIIRWPIEGTYPKLSEIDFSIAFSPRASEDQGQILISCLLSTSPIFICSFICEHLWGSVFLQSLMTLPWHITRALRHWVVNWENIALFGVPKCNDVWASDSLCESCHVSK